MAPTKQSTRCIFTLNNYTDKDIELLKPFYVDYCKCLVCGKEVGEVELTPHLQGFFTLKTKLSMTGVHRALGTKAIALIVVIYTLHCCCAGLDVAQASSMHCC